MARTQNRRYLYGALTRAIGQVLIDHARNRAAQKRGGNKNRDQLTDVEDPRSESQIEGYLPVNELLEKLDEEKGAIFRLHAFLEYTFPEIATMLEMPEEVVKAKYRQVQAHLRKCLEPGQDG